VSASLLNVLSLLYCHLIPLIAVICICTYRFPKCIDWLSDRRGIHPVEKPVAAITVEKQVKGLGKSTGKVVEFCATNKYNKCTMDQEL